ncbi:flagellar motor switch protein FliN [Alcaligenes sp. SDU_A2]|uniref:flagellar motor switch protein FliN n=1 Tax=Alcaligenes sp. SDU_A2 TaxID=3136634 RepID=UPI00311ED57D
MTDPLNPNDRSAPEDDWAAAMAEQQAGQANQAQGLGQPLDDDWASALAEQTAASTPTADPTASAAAASALFQPIHQSHEGGGSDIDMIMDIPVQLSVELGRTRLTIKNILQLGQGSVVELDGLAGEPLDIYVNGYLIAQGEVVVVDEKYGIRVTDIITPSDRIQRLNGRR